MEKLLKQFKNHIIYWYEQKIKQLENNQKPIVNSTKGLIYIIRASNEDDDLYFALLVVACACIKLEWHII